MKPASSIFDGVNDEQAIRASMGKLVLDLTNAGGNLAEKPDYRNRPARDASKLVEGQLLDVSTHGFKLRHDCLELTPGRKVQVLYSWGKVWAYVIWTKEQGLHYQSGFELGQEE